MRELVAECVAPLRDKVITNNEQIMNITRDALIQADKLGKLEVVYFNRDESGDPSSGLSRPKTIFDTINNKIADYASQFKRTEQQLEAKIA